MFALLIVSDPEFEIGEAKAFLAYCYTVCKTNNTVSDNIMRKTKNWLIKYTKDMHSIQCMKSVWRHLLKPEDTFKREDYNR